MKTNKAIEVFYHDKHVGTLAETRDKKVAFQYSDSWQKNGFSISPFSLPLGNDVYIPNDYSRERFDGLFGVFADSLPDSWGNLLLDRYLSSVGVKREDISVLDRLAYIGSAGMGALEYRPAIEADYHLDIPNLDYDVISNECSKLLSSQVSDKLDMLYKIAGSSGGTRPKILISEDGKEWIVKFPAGNDPAISGKREYDYSVAAVNCGIKMTKTVLAPSKLCEGYFKTERFDRNGGEKIFSITFAGLLETDFRAPSCDYSTYMKLIKRLTKDNIEDKKQMFLLMAFNTYTHNLDDHTKNFSFLYTEDEGWRLAPAYDITYSDTYWGEHTTSVNGKGKDITDEDLIKVGLDAGLTEKYCRQSLDNVTENIKALKLYLNKKYTKAKKVSLYKRIDEVSGPVE